MFDAHDDDDVNDTNENCSNDAGNNSMILIKFLLFEVRLAIRKCHVFRISVYVHDLRQ